MIIKKDLKYEECVTAPTKACLRYRDSCFDCGARQRGSRLDSGFSEPASTPQLPSLTHGPGHSHGTAQGRVLGSPGPGRPSPPTPPLAARPRPGPSSQNPGFFCGSHWLDPISREPQGSWSLPPTRCPPNSPLRKRCFTFFEVGVALKLEDSRSLAHTKSHSQSHLRHKSRIVRV